MDNNLTGRIFAYLLLSIVVALVALAGYRVFITYSQSSLLATAGF